MAFLEKCCKLSIIQFFHCPQLFPRALLYANFSQALSFYDQFLLTIVTIGCVLNFVQLSQEYNGILLTHP